MRKDYFVLYGIGRFDKIKGHCLEKGLSSLRAYYEFDIDGDGNTVINQKAEYDRASKIEQLVDQINHDMTRYAVNNQALDVEELENLLILLNKNKLQYRRTKKELSR
ncbi:hypothetical protein JCM19236_6632 [Vibrio sp. JCM 19236]|nr:hypothetical protein JCM19236_6632 [Vibrio sp. JCM 19236]